MEKHSSWDELKNNVAAKYDKSIANPTLVLYSFAAIFLLGNLGFWVELFSYTSSKTCTLDPMVKSLITFFPAVAIPACMQLNISDLNSKAEKALSIVIAVIIAFSALALGIFPSTLDSGLILAVCICMSIFAYFIWLVINADNNDFKDPDSDAALGGPVNSNMSGSLKGLKS